MGKVLGFRLRTRPTRDQAKQWLVANVAAFPEALPGDVGPSLFHGWRFVRSTDGDVYFANCVERGIDDGEFQACAELGS